MGITDITIDELMDEINAAFGCEELAPDEFTLVQFCQRENVSSDRAKVMLAKAIGQGLIEPVDKEVMLNGKRHFKVYRRKV